MSTQTDEISSFAPHITGDEHHGYDAEEAAQHVLNYMELHGGTLYVFESSYWGNEAFGDWIEMVIADPVVETDNGGLKVKNAIRVSKVVSLLDEWYQAADQLDKYDDPEKEPDFDTFGRQRWEDQVGAAMAKMWNGVSNDYDKSDWFPASKVVFQTSRRGRPDMVIFGSDGSRERGVGEDAEVVIEDTTTVRTRHSTYRKLAIDIPYKEDFSPNDDIDDLTWDDHHFTAKYDHNDNFECWTADKMPREIAQILAQHYDGVAVHENILEQYDQ